MIGSIIGDVVGNAGAVSNIKETRVMEATIGINQRIPIEAIELAIKAVMNGSYDNDYAAELARIAENGGYPPTQNGDIRSLFWLFSLMALQN